MWALRRLLVSASNVSDVLNLPWELLRPLGRDFLGIDPRFSIRRLPSSGSELPQFQGAAATLHNLASIDLDQGEYEAARKKFETALEMRQQIGDRAGVAATLTNIGIMAAKEGHAREGLRLAALGATIMDAIGHANIEQVVPWIDSLASTLGYSQELIEAMYEESAEAYRQDKGWGLVEAALGAR